MTVPNIICSVAGKPKTGKTHFCFTFPSPLTIFSFDIGLEPILKKFPNKEVNVKTYPIPLIDTVKPKPYAVEIWAAFRKDYDEVMKAGAGTAIIDTATALYEIARHARAEELKQANLLQFQYGEVYSRMSAILMAPRLSGVNLVLTHHLRDRYVQDSNTGEKELDGYKRTEGLVDVVLWSYKDIQTVPKTKDNATGKQTIFSVRIADNRFEPEADGIVLESPTYDDLMPMLGLIE